MESSLIMTVLLLLPLKKRSQSKSLKNKPKQVSIVVNKPFQIALDPKAHTILASAPIAAANALQPSTVNFQKRKRNQIGVEKDEEQLDQGSSSAKESKTTAV